MYMLYKYYIYRYTRYIRLYNNMYVCIYVCMYTYFSTYTLGSSEGR